MAQNIIGHVTGAAKKVLDGVETVLDIKKQLGVESYKATINGDPAEDDEELSDGDYINLSPAVKGGVI